VERAGTEALGAIPARLFAAAKLPRRVEKEFFIDNLLVRIHFIIVMIRWTGLAPWEFEFPFPGSPTSTFLVPPGKLREHLITFQRLLPESHGQNPDLTV